MQFDLITTLKEIEKYCSENDVKHIAIGNIEISVKAITGFRLDKPFGGLPSLTSIMNDRIENSRFDRSGEVQPLKEKEQEILKEKAIDPSLVSNILLNDLGTNPNYPDPKFDSALFNKYKAEHDSIGKQQEEKKQASTIEDILNWPQPIKTE